EGLLDRLFAVRGLGDVEARELQVRGVHLARILVVLHDQHERLCAPSRHRRRAFAGSLSVNVDPFASSLSSSIAPPSICASRRQMERPSPVPPYPRVGEVSSWRKSSNTLA